LAIGSHRLIGFAFASADLLVEVSPQGQIAFAMGAAEALSGSPETALVGRAWRDFVDPADHAMLATFLEGLEPGARAGPVLVRLAAPERAATLTAFRLPENDGAISCALTKARREPAADDAMRRALNDAGALGAAIRDKAFRLAYQPVVRLDGSALHHFEVLVRFGDEESPFPQIRMAEELDLIEALDFAILERATETLVRNDGLKLAVNVSGRTIGSSAYVARAIGLIAAKPSIRGRLMFELTESAAIDDLALADRHLQALRTEGCEICLDDFGTGTASFAYLQQLHLDVVKIDGRYIRDLQYGGRDATFVKHLVRMCHELGMKTLAEMVETAAVEAEVRRAGVDFAQGWLYGLATDEPIAPTANVAAA